MLFRYVTATVILPFTTTFAEPLSAQETRDSFSEFGVEWGYRAHSTSPLGMSTSAPLSVRWSIALRKRMGYTGTFTVHERRLETQRSYAGSAHGQYEYFLSGNRTNESAFYALLGTSLVHSRLVSSADSTPKKWLWGATTGIGRRQVVPSGSVRIELVASSEAGVRHETISSAGVPGRRSLGVRLSYLYRCCE